jgi:prophage DNA circulation protein
MRKKRLSRASFRGVKFYLEEFSVESARRVEKVEYPNSEAFSTEDLGAQIKSYYLNGFVLGPDFESEREKLLAACSDPGPGKLVIPYFKELSAHCLSVRTNETTITGGMVSFAMTFCESSQPALDVSHDPSSLSLGFLNQLVGLAGKVLDRGVLLYNSLGGEFITSSFDLVSRWGDSLFDASDSVLSGADRVEKSFIPILKLTYGANQLSAAISEYKKTFLNTANVPWMLFDSVRNLATSLCDPFLLYQLETLLMVMDSIPSPVPPISEYVSVQAQEQRAQLHETFQTAVGSVVVGEAATAALKADYESQESLIQTREFLIHRIDDLKQRTQDDETFQTLESLKTLIFHSLQPSQKTTTLRDYTVFTDMPAIVATYDATGDIDQLGAIIQRNKITYPPRIQAGTSGRRLEVAYE